MMVGEELGLGPDQSSDEEVKQVRRPEIGVTMRIMASLCGGIGGWGKEAG